MKRYSLILCMVLVVSLSGVASAQIVLGPPPAAVGGASYVYWHIIPNSTTFTSYTTLQSPLVGGISYAVTVGGVGISFYNVYGGALEFNGTDEYLTVPDSTTLDAVRISIGAWVYPHDVSISDFGSEIFFKGDPSPGIGYFFKIGRVTEGRLGFYSSGLTMEAAITVKRSQSPLFSTMVSTGYFCGSLSTYGI